MARPIKVGLSYFPIDVDIFEDTKIQFVSARFGMKGEALVFRLLAKIYREGYYIDFDEDAMLLFAKSCDMRNEKELVNDVVKELVKRGFFDKDIFNSFAVLTSKGIQRRYVKICNDSKRLCNNLLPKYNLLQSKQGFTTEETKLTTEENTQSKVKEKKEKESKENKIFVADFNKFSSEESISAEETKAELIKNEKLAEYLGMTFKIKDSEQRETLIAEFVKQKDVEELFPRKLSESKKHFMMWINKKHENGNNSTTKYKSDNKRPIEPVDGRKFGGW